MIEASTQFMVGRLSTESGKCNSFNLDGIFGNDKGRRRPDQKPYGQTGSLNFLSFQVIHPKDAI